MKEEPFQRHLGTCVQHNAQSPCDPRIWSYMHWQTWSLDNWNSWWKSLRLIEFPELSGLHSGCRRHKRWSNWARQNHAHAQAKHWLQQHSLHERQVRSIGFRSSWQLFSMSIFSKLTSKHGLHSFSCWSKHAHLHRREYTRRSGRSSKRVVRRQVSTQTLKERRSMWVVGGRQITPQVGERSLLQEKVRRNQRH